MSDDDLGEFTRFRANIQLGDGPDQRGDVTVEVVREPSEDRHVRPVTIPTGDDTADIEVESFADDEAFAEFYREISRARRTLAEQLGLPEEDVR